MFTYIWFTYILPLGRVEKEMCERETGKSRRPVGTWEWAVSGTSWALTGETSENMPYVTRPLG